MEVIGIIQKVVNYYIGYLFVLQKQFQAALSRSDGASKNHIWNVLGARVTFLRQLCV